MITYSTVRLVCSTAQFNGGGFLEILRLNWVLSISWTIHADSECMECGRSMQTVDRVRAEYADGRKWTACKVDMCALFQ